MADSVSTKNGMQNEELGIDNAEISLKDIVAFFKRNQRLILLCGVSGLLLSTAYLALTPKKFEAILQIQMAQFGNSSNDKNNINDNDRNNIILSNSEEPVALIYRLRAPTTYPVEVQQSCGILENTEFGDYLGGMLKAETIKNLSNAVEMKVRAPSSDQARKCAEAIVTMVVAQQHGLTEERLAGLQELLKMNQQALQRDLQLFDNIKRSESFKYLAKLERINALNMRIDALQEALLMSQQHPAKLVSPISAPSTPVSRKVGLLLLAGMSLGVMLSMLYALGREGWRKVA